jgi:hyperosmotically inducible periplasmic protein
MKKRLQAGMILGATLLAAQMGFAGTEAGAGRIEKEVRRQLVTLPFYSLFDNFSYKVEGDTVTLMGKVSRPTLKSDAERAVKRIEGVEKISNQIDVLPLSAHDDQLRMDLYYSIYGHSVLQNLAVRSVPPVHIIVENGHVTLEGVVSNEMEKNIARLQANGVRGVFSVTDNLRVESES